MKPIELQTQQQEPDPITHLNTPFDRGRLQPHSKQDQLTPPTKIGGGDTLQIGIDANSSNNHLIMDEPAQYLTK